MIYYKLVIQKFIKIFALPILIAFLSVLFVQQAHADVNTGSISVCKIIVDQNNNIVDGSGVAGATFTINGFTPNPVTSQGNPAGVIPTTTFTTPLTLNSHILTATQGNDSQCITYSNLPFGSYYWGQETTPGGVWQTPFYSDQYTGPANDIINLYSYDSSLFTDPAHEDLRNLNSDGNIILSADRPDRELILLNKYIPTVSLGGNNNNNGGSNNNSGSTSNSGTQQTSSVSITPPPAGNGGNDNFTTTVLGATDNNGDKTSSTETAISGICSACLWWPMLLGEILFLTAWLFVAKKKKLSISRILGGAIIAALAYIIFLLFNRGHSCPEGNITFWLLSIPCRFFWAVDLTILIILTFLFHKRK